MDRRTQSANHGRLKRTHVKCSRPIMRIGLDAIAGDNTPVHPPLFKIGLDIIAGDDASSSAALTMQEIPVQLIREVPVRRRQSVKAPPIDWTMSLTVLTAWCAVFTLISTLICLALLH